MNTHPSSLLALSQHIPNCLVIQYADVTQLIHTGNINNIQDLVHRGKMILSQAKRYFHLNGLLLNTSKTQCMFVGSRGLKSQIPANTCLRVDETNIFPSCSLKIFGIYFYSHMAFNTYVNKISKKIFSTILYINSSLSLSLSLSPSHHYTTRPPQ